MLKLTEMKGASLLPVKKEHDGSCSLNYGGLLCDCSINRKTWNEAVTQLEQCSVEVEIEEMAFIIYKIGMRNLASEDEIKHEFKMHYITWNPTVNEALLKAQALSKCKQNWLRLEVGK